MASARHAFTVSILLLAATCSEARAQSLDLFGLFDRGAGLNERFDADRLQDLRPEWMGAALHPDYTARMTLRQGALLLEAPPVVGAVAVVGVQVPADAAEMGVTLSRWAGQQPVFGLVWGDARQTFILMLTPEGTLALSGCSAEACWDHAYARVPFEPAPGEPVQLALRRTGEEAADLSRLEFFINGQPVLTTWMEEAPGRRFGIYAGAGTTVEMDQFVVRALEEPVRAERPAALSGATTWVLQEGDDRIRTMQLTIGGLIGPSAWEHEWTRTDGGWRVSRSFYGSMALLTNPEGTSTACTSLRASGNDPAQTRCFQFAQRAPGPEAPAQTCFLDRTTGDGPLGCLAYRTDATGDVLYDEQGRAWTRATRVGDP